MYHLKPHSCANGRQWRKHGGHVVQVSYGCLKGLHTCELHANITFVVQRIIFVIIHNFLCQFLCWCFYYFKLSLFRCWTRWNQDRWQFHQIPKAGFILVNRSCCEHFEWYISVGNRATHVYPSHSHSITVCSIILFVQPRISRAETDNTLTFSAGMYVKLSSLMHVNGWCCWWFFCGWPFCGRVSGIY